MPTLFDKNYGQKAETSDATERSDPDVSLSRLLTRLLAGLGGLCRRPALPVFAVLAVDTRNNTDEPRQ